MSVLANSHIIWMSGKENDFLLQLKIWAVEIVFSRLITLINYFVQLIEIILPEETQWEQGILSVSNSQNSPGSGIVRIKGWVLLRQSQQTNSPSPCWHNGHSSHICRDLLDSVLFFAWASQKFFIANLIWHLLWEGKCRYLGDMLILSRWCLFSQCSYLFQNLRSLKECSIREDTWHTKC